MNIINASKIGAITAFILLSSVLTVQAFDTYYEMADDTYFSEFIGGRCTLEQEQQARNDAKEVISRQVAISPLEDESGKFYSEWVGGDVTLAEENQAMEAAREIGLIADYPARLQKYDIGLGYTPIGETPNCSYSEWDGAYICR